MLSLGSLNVCQSVDRALQSVYGVLLCSATESICLIGKIEQMGSVLLLVLSSDFVSVWG